MRYFSMFSGIGGFELGIQRAFNNQCAHFCEESKQKECKEWRIRNPNLKKPLFCTRPESALCVGYSEIDKHAIKTYTKHFGGHKNYGDATKIIATELPDFDLLCGGFPCQAFSIAGRRQGFQDTRGTLFFEIARILESKKPSLVLLENVKGLLNHDQGNTFRVIILSLWELGYDVQWMVLNSKFHGVPQNRERVFIIGNLRGTSRPEILPLREHGQKTEEGFKNGMEQTASTIQSRHYANWKGNYVGTLRTHNDGNGFRQMKENISPCLNGRAREDGTGQSIVAIPVLTPDRINKRQNGRRFKEAGEESFTLTGQDKHGVMVSGTLTAGAHSGGLHSDMEGIIEEAGIRRLTPIECERLQGFPDNWTDGISDSQRYKQLGNAVTVNVIEAIIKKMYEGKI